MATVNGTAGKDFIHMAGDGLIAPEGYNDITGVTAVADIINPGAGADIVHGGNGNDRIMAYDLADVDGLAEQFYGGSGTDGMQFMVGGAVDISNMTFVDCESVVVIGSFLSVTMTPLQMSTLRLNAESGDFVMSEAGTVSYHQSSFMGTMIGSSGNDTISLAVDNKGDFAIEGRAGDDIISVGGSANTTLSGDDGDDIITGGKKADIIDGGADDDLLTGGKKDDSLTGGTGADQFVLKSLTDSALDRSDVITDFSQAQGDRINLKKIDADLSVIKDQAFHLGGGVFTQTAGELIQFQQGGQTIVQGDVNGDGQADFALILNGTLTLTASDFLL